MRLRAIAPVYRWMKQLCLVIAALLAWPRSAGAQSFDLAIDFEGNGSGAALLVAHLPAGKQASLQANFDQILTAYRQIESKFRIAKDEPAGALAAFVAGNIAAARHSTISDAAFPALLGQVRAALRTHPDVARSLHLDRLPVREQLEIIGMLMMGSALGKPDANQAAMLETAAKRYLTSYLGVDAQALELSDRGLVWSGAATGPLAVLTGNATTAPAAAPPTGSGPPAASAPPGGDGGDIASKIDGVGTKIDAQFVGTNYTYYERETWVFKDGMCTGSVRRVFESGSLAADRSAHPKEWSKCRRIKDDVEEHDGKGWKKLDLYMRDRLPKGFALEGKFTNEQFQSSYGNAFAAWKTFAFDRSGHFESGGGAGGSTTGYSGGGTAVNTKRTPARGTYSIDGYVLTLRYDDGHVEHRGFFADPKKLDRVYINGTTYRR